MVYIILGNGFESAEALVPCDLMRRAGIEVSLASIGDLAVRSGQGITVCCDCCVDEVDLERAEMIVLPGGMGGVREILASARSVEIVRSAYEKGVLVAAICAAPSVLAGLGITDGKKVVCYPGLETQMGRASICNETAVRDGKIITGRSAGASFEFGLELIRALKGNDAADDVARAVVYSND